MNKRIAMLRLSLCCFLYAGFFLRDSVAKGKRSIDYTLFINELVFFLKENGLKSFSLFFLINIDFLLMLSVALFQQSFN